MSDKKSGASETAVGWGILLVVLAALSWLVWKYFSEEIKNVIRWIRYSEMWVVSWFLGEDHTVSWQGQEVKFHEVMGLTKTIPTQGIDENFMSLMAAVALNPYIGFITVLALVFAFWALFKGPGSEHRTTFDLDGIIKKQANIFPVISPFLNFNPAKMPARAPGADVPADLPLFAEALAPEEWIVYNEIPVIDKKIDIEATNKAFTKQLGGRWKGYKHLEPYQQVLLAAFCLKANRKRSDSDVMLGRLALCWSQKKGMRVSSQLVKEARSVLSNDKLSGSILKKCNEHAFETTALMRGLMTAREEGGVLAPAQFVWLRGHNRTLWYPLNNLGRQSLHTEAMGAMAHYKAEKLARRPIPRPKVEDATKSLSEYLSSGKARTLPQLDYGNSKKRGIKKLKTA